MATILVVEDEAEVRDAIAQILRAGDHTVIEAADGRDGLDQFYLRQPNLIICDILMPERDGLELIGALRDAGIEVPIIAMLEQDAGQAAVLQDLAIGLGANALLAKPLLATELLETLAPLLSSVAPP
ncbi:MAG TPA: response regulator [Phenylobacterium sp.]|nr:response regulator [Phenylobacterium sp.]